MNTAPTARVVVATSLALAASLVGGCQRPARAPTGAADIIFTNADVVTMDAGRPAARAVAVRGQRIIAVGDVEQVELRGPATQVVNLQGRTLVPGFVDSHQYRVQKFGLAGFATAAEAVQSAVAQGWTTLHELYAEPSVLAQLVDLDRAGALPVWVDAYLPFMQYDAAGTSLGDWYQAYHQGQQLSPHVRVAGLIGFADFDNAAALLFTQDQLNAVLLQAARAGWTVALKTVSTRSLAMIIKAYDYVENVLPGVAGRRGRLEHALFITPDQVAQIKRLGLVPVINLNNPGQLVGESDVDELITREPNGSYTPWRSLEQAGLAVANGTGWPSYYVDEPTGAPFGSPLHLAYQAVTRVGNHGTRPYPWLLDQTITAAQALREMSMGGAYAAFEDDVKGSITPGKLADLVVLSGNPTQVPTNDINNLKVVMTMVGGRVRWCAPGGQALCPGQGSPTVTTRGPSDPVLGAWTAMDPNDGSQMTLQVSRDGRGYRVILIDELAATCGLDGAGNPRFGAKIDATGTISGNVLSVPVTTVTCLSEPPVSKTISVTWSYTYQPATDTLVNADQRETWQRQ